MNKKTTLVFTFIVLCFALNARPQAAPASQGYSVSGFVTTKSDKKLLAGARITLHRHTVNPIELVRTKQFTTETDANGNWTIKDLSAGQYKIKVAAPSKDSKLASVTTIIEITNTDIRGLAFELPSESSISGTIIVTGGARLPDPIFLIATDETRGIVSGTEISTNDFRIGNLSEGEYLLNLSAGDGYYAETFSVGGDRIGDSPIRLKDGEHFQNVKIVLSNKTGKAKGKVHPDLIRGVTLVVLIPIAATAKTAMRASTPEAVDDEGNFEIIARPGEYYLTLVTPEDMDRRDESQVEAWFREITRNAKKIIINANETTSVEFSSGS